MSDKFQLVSILDPAIDHERMSTDDAIKYVKSRDMADIKPFFRAGNHPTIFHCREVPHALWETYVENCTTEGQRARRAFQCGVIAVENLHDEEGRRIEHWTPPQEREGVMPDADLGRFPPRDREEIGLVILQRSFLGRRIKIDYRAPLTSLVMLERLLLQYAELNQAKQANNNDEASSSSGSPAPASSETASATTKCGDESGSATDAPAQESKLAAG